MSYEDLKSVVVCPPVIQEVLQGVRSDTHWLAVYNGLMALPRIGDAADMRVFIEAAEIFREGRKKGYTIRSSTDCLIAAMAISAKIPVHHFDRDFDLIAKFTSFKVVKFMHLTTRSSSSHLGPPSLRTIYSGILV